MKIGNAKYCKGVGSFEDTNTSITCTIDGQVWNVPLDPYNSHYQAIQEWVSKGNKIAEAD